MRVGRCAHHVVAAMVGCLPIVGCIAEASDPPTLAPLGQADSGEETDGGATVPKGTTTSESTSGSSSTGSSGSSFVDPGRGGSAGSSSSSSRDGASDSGLGVGSSGSSGTGESSGSGAGSSGSSGGLSSDSGSGSSSGGSIGYTFDASTGCPPPSGATPTWSSIWTKDGFSNTCHSCHKQASSASTAYTWLKQQGQISGTTSPIASEENSVLYIFQGSMPPDGNGIDEAAKCAIVDWAAAGASND
jgi:hypothetical protein